MILRKRKSFFHVDNFHRTNLQSLRLPVVIGLLFNFFPIIYTYSHTYSTHIHILSDIVSLNSTLNHLSYPEKYLYVPLAASSNKTSPSFIFHGIFKMLLWPQCIFFTAINSFDEDLHISPIRPVFDQGIQMKKTPKVSSLIYNSIPARLLRHWLNKQIWAITMTTTDIRTPWVGLYEAVIIW